MNAAIVAGLPRLPPPASAGEPRAHVWLEARHFFTRDSAQQFCWLWMLGGDRRVHALRLPAACAGDAHRARALLVHFNAAPDLPIRAAPGSGFALPLPAAPIVPLPRWHVSWGHPLQQALRAFAAQLDQDVLAALGALEGRGAFFGSVSNYNWLAVLPATIRQRRLQALAEFPPLVAPLLLDVYTRPDMFGTDEDEPRHAAVADRGACAAVLDAMDRGRDLVGALAAHYRIDRALVRSPMLREPWGQGFIPRDVLALLKAMPAHARPRTRAEVEDRLPLLRALPLPLRVPADIAHLAGVFAQGWNATWRQLDGRVQGSPRPHLNDTRDFLRAALAEPALPDIAAHLDVQRLCLAWLARCGLPSLLDASLRWHAQPLVPQPPVGDPAGVRGSLCVINPILGDSDADATFKLEDRGSAREIVNQQALVEEGETMHHCVGGYWRMCVVDGVRIVHITLADGESATAEYWLHGPVDNPTFTLEELRGPCNAEASDAAWGFAEATLAALNATACRGRRIAAALAIEAERSACRPSAPPVAVRRLDRRSRHELRLVLAWCARHVDAGPPPPLLHAPIAGFMHAQGAQVFAQLAPGDALQLVREHANPHDANAVRIDWRGHKLGYVPRGCNADIARRLDAGETLVAAIAKLAQDANAWDPVMFEIAAAMP